MAKGRAHGEDRDYQILARDIMQELSQGESLVPYSGDGIDVPFELGGSAWGLDVVLKSVDGSKIVVAECKRWASPIEQGHIGEFAWKVELLRKLLNKAVSGIYFTKTGYQIGAVKVGAWSGIELAVCEQGQSPKQTFSLSYHRYDPEREIRLKGALVRVKAICMVTGVLSARVTGADGTVEELGELKL